MGIYNGTGYFIDYKDLTQLTISDVRAVFPTIDKILIEPLALEIKQTILLKNSMLALLVANNLVSDACIIQYGCRVCFAGKFEKLFDESDLSPDSGDFETVQKLLESDGYDYAVSNETELDHHIEMLIAILENYHLISEYDILETYWFIMPYPINRKNQDHQLSR
ncbi:MAG: hypothetical protein RR310_09065 [Eubacterium sp.]